MGRWYRIGDAECRMLNAEVNVECGVLTVAASFGQSHSTFIVRRRDDARRSSSCDRSSTSASQTSTQARSKWVPDFAVEDRAHALGRHPGAIRPIGRQGVDDVGNGQDAGGCRERVAREPATVALAVNPFVMIGGVDGELR